MDTISVLQNKRIILAVAGSIAAYKAADLASKLTQGGALVDVILTDAAQKFVTPLTFEALTGRAVYTDVWDAPHGADGLPTHIAHVGLAESADMIVVAPATAHHIAKLANGFADDLLCITALAARCPLVIAPAMDGSMYEHPATARNVALLKERGAVIIEPETGRFASGLTGRGRLPETNLLLGAIRYQLGQQAGSLRGRQVVVTAGGTHEAIDPVRYITNRSSGKQGYAIAQAALDAGAQVTLISTPTGLSAPAQATLVEVESAAQMLDAVLATLPTADVLIMAAAVADYRPETVAAEKIKKDDGGLNLNLIRTEDILYRVGSQRAPGQRPYVLVGFAAETQEMLQNAQGKLRRKNADFIIANDVSKSGAGFAVETNIVTILSADGTITALPQQSKATVAEQVIGRVAARLKMASENPVPNPQVHSEAPVAPAMSQHAPQQEL